MAAGSKTAGVSWSGALDMSGNVWEWVEDWSHSNYTGAPTDGSAWVLPVGTLGVFRGDGFASDASGLRSSLRSNAAPDKRSATFGGRCVRDLPITCGGIAWSPSACDTGLLGVCAAGTSACRSRQVTCLQNVQAATETCNDLDDNCDGVVDNVSQCVDDSVCCNGQGCSGNSVCHFVSTVAVQPLAPTVFKGLTQAFDATALFDDLSMRAVTTLATWSTSNNSVVTISNTPGTIGQAAAVNLGTATITAAYGGKTGLTTVTVSCAAHCQTCTNATTCTLCESGWGGAPGSCSTNCSSFDRHCTTCSATTCSTCSTNWTWDASIGCVPTFWVSLVGDPAVSPINVTTAQVVVKSFPANHGNNMTTVASLGSTLTVGGTSQPSALLTLTGDGRYVMTAGMQLAPGVSTVGKSLGANNPWSVVRLDGNGVTTATTITSVTGVAPAYAQFTGATSQDGNDYWAHTTVNGVFYGTFGSPTLGSLGTNPGSVSTLQVVDEQLFGVSHVSPFEAVNTIGLGLPTSGTQVWVPLPGMPSTGSDYLGFSLVDWDGNGALDTLYASTSAGLEKWRLSGSTWVQVTTNTCSISGGDPSGCRALAATRVGAETWIIAIRTDQTGTSGVINYLVLLKDASWTGTAMTKTAIAVSESKTAFRGISLAPQAP